MHTKIRIKAASFVFTAFLLSVLAASCGEQGVQFLGRKHQIWSFDKERVESVPQGWKVAETSGEGKLARWQVITDQSAPKAAETEISTLYRAFASGAKSKEPR